MKTKYDDKKACGHMAAFLVACLNTQLFKNCPQASWTDGMIFIYFYRFYIFSWLNANIIIFLFFIRPICVHS